MLEKAEQSFAFTGSTPSQRNAKARDVVTARAKCPRHPSELVTKIQFRDGQRVVSCGRCTGVGTQVANDIGIRIATLERQIAELR